jgi:hypothetical protein
MKKWLGALTALVFSGAIAYGANIPLLSGPQYSEPSQILATINYLITQINSLITPQSLATYTVPRNLLDNGGMQVLQRGTAARTCGTTTIPSSAYAADRWGCNVNVTSGAGSLQVVTTNLPAQPVFNDAQLFYRTSGALAQPQCVMQEIPTSRVVPLQGQAVTLSFYAYGLANMLAEQTTLNAYLFTGTGTDQGLQSFTASPAITPAWTGIASTQTTAFTLTSSYQRLTATYQIPATAKEAAIALCWTPTTGGTAGATDGFEFTGIQLEQGTSASAFEYRTFQDELKIAQTFFIRYNEINTAGAIQFGGGTALGTSTTCSIAIPFPVTMFKAPTYANALSATTFTITSASQAATALSTPFSATLGANGVNNGSINFTTTGMTAKDGCEITSTAAGSGVLDFTADF